MLSTNVPDRASFRFCRTGVSSSSESCIGFLNLTATYHQRILGWRAADVKPLLDEADNTSGVLARAAAAAAITVVTATGCAVARNQQTAGSYIDDAGITTTVKGKFIEDKVVAASSIRVETLNGTVQLSGFAKSSAERNQAEAIARGVKGVKSVKNDIVIRP